MKEELMLFVLIGIIIATVITFMIWYLYGKNESVLSMECYYPSFYMNCAELGTVFSGSAGKKEVVSLFFYLANKGYIKIFGVGTNIKLIKIKEYDGNNQIEKMIMQECFSAKNHNTYKGLSKSSYFYKTCYKIIDILNNEKKKYVCEKSCSIEMFIYISLCIFAILFLMLYSFNNYSFSFVTGIFKNNIPALIFPLMAYIFAMISFKNCSLKLSKLVISIFFGGIPLLILCLKLQLLNINLEIGIIGLICLVISLVCLLKMQKKRNQKGKIALETALGLKNFLKTAQKEQILSLMNENPDYCFEMLPYAYVLGVEHEFIQSFKEIVYYPPKWFKTYNYSTELFYSFFKNFEKLLNRTDSNGGNQNTKMGMIYAGHYYK